MLITTHPGIREAMAYARYGREVMHSTKMDTPRHAQAERFHLDARIDADRILARLRELRAAERERLGVGK